MIDTNNIFNFYHIFRNELIGDTTLFIFISYGLANYFLLKSKTSYKITIIVNVLLSGLMFEMTRNLLIWTLLLLYVGYVTYSTFNKLLKR